mmetsp:Transcript_3173/g.7437  ORF Transcript_3173/g.7437 Transcript_3173/m.7437 type:complete len:92 (+) Transcript_3173:68-343(+)
MLSLPGRFAARLCSTLPLLRKAVPQLQNLKGNLWPRIRRLNGLRAPLMAVQVAVKLCTSENSSTSPSLHNAQVETMHSGRAAEKHLGTSLM